ncbi:RGS domain-containing serine/threonine-protein kinase A-like isoform X1 [Panonychus citri]|uniref:RGS domain-containing serine/threonine-protein kinase A-like isoform X1 n=1 Tax=Panonychus citri TaxID=50023 RepID=UPI0023080BEA|nr:RGS domain-containing serine/threonine-protein kinase A-like isoform X1 [Panonychus citri]
MQSSISSPLTTTKTSSTTTTSSTTSCNRIFCEKSTQIGENDVDIIKLQQQFALTSNQHQQLPSKNYVGLMLPQWYRPKAPSTLLRRRTRSKQWVTYEVEVNPGRKKLINKTINVSSTINNQLESKKESTKINSLQNSLINPVNLNQIKSSSTNARKGSMPRYHLMKGFVSDVDDNTDGQGVDNGIDDTEPQQKVKLAVLLLMIPSIVVMFYSQTKFRRESNVVGDLSGLGLPHNYLSNGLGPGSFGSRDFTSKFNPLHDYQMKSEQTNDYDPFDNLHYHQQPKTNHNHDQIKHEKNKDHTFDELSKMNTEQSANSNNQENNNNQANQKETIKSTVIVEGKDKDTNDYDESTSESKLMRIKINNLKINSDYKVIIYENANQFNNYNHLSTSESMFSHCPNEHEKLCLITNDINLINISDAIIFTDHHLHPNEQLTQTIVNNHLISIFYSLSPIEWSKSLQSKFNLTLTYHYQANITYRPVLVEKKLIDGVREQNQDNTDQRNGQSSDKINETNESAFDLWRNKRKLVLIVTSDCNIDQELITFATIMERLGIDIDLVSLCDKKVCPSLIDDKSLELCFKSIAEPYLFLFDWQSLICPQFVSPFVYLALSTNLIPIVAHPIIFNEDDYNLPKSSFINSLHFSTLHELGDHLNLIASDLNQYSTYIQWKQTHEISLARNDLCHLCSVLHGDQSVLNSQHILNDKLTHPKDNHEKQSVNQQCVYWKNVYTFTELKQNLNK